MRRFIHIHPSYIIHPSHFLVFLGSSTLPVLGMKTGSPPTTPSGKWITWVGACVAKGPRVSKFVFLNGRQWDSKEFFNLFRYKNWVDWLEWTLISLEIMSLPTNKNQLLLTHLLGGVIAQWNFGWNRVQEKALKRDANGDLDPDLQTKSLPPRICVTHQLYVQYTVYGSILFHTVDIHSFSHPWAPSDACFEKNRARITLSSLHRLKSHFMIPRKSKSPARSWLPVEVDIVWHRGFSENPMSFGWKC